MLDDEGQRQLATRMGKRLAALGLQVVFVGSTAIVGLELFSRTSKDTDALGPVGLTLDRAREIMRRIAGEEKLTLQEKGSGVIAAIRHDDRGNIVWEVDLLVPGEGLIPEAAARRIHARAVETRIGRTAIAEHVLATKAIAWGDCIGKQDPESASKYENDLLQMRTVLEEKFSWEEVEALLARFEDARRRAAADKIHETFGRDVGRDRSDPSVA